MKIIQIGCGDGNDHVFKWCQKYRDELEQLVLIDAHPQSLKKCAELYDKEGILAEYYNYAVIPIDGVNEIQFFTPSNPEYALFTSINQEHITTHMPKSEVLSFTAPATSLNNVLQQYSGQDLDWLFIDCEGMDALNLLSVDFSKFKIKNIVFEDIHTDGVMQTGNRFDALELYLKSFGYELNQDEENLGAYNTWAHLKQI